MCALSGPFRMLQTHYHNQQENAPYHSRGWKLLNQASADWSQGGDTCSYIKGISLLPNMKERVIKPHQVYLITLTHSEVLCPHILINFHMFPLIIPPSFRVYMPMWCYLKFSVSHRSIDLCEWHVFVWFMCMQVSYMFIHVMCRMYICCIFVNKCMFVVYIYVCSAQYGHACSVYFTCVVCSLFMICGLYAWLCICMLCICLSVSYVYV